MKKIGTKHKDFARKWSREEKKRKDSRASYQKFGRRNLKTLLWSLEKEENGGIFLLQGLTYMETMKVQVCDFREQMMRKDAKLVMCSIDKFEWPLYRPGGMCKRLLQMGVLGFEFLDKNG